MSLIIREATSDDLPAILALYAQPGMDDGITLPLGEAEEIFKRMQSYPNYRLYVASMEGQIVGTFALLIMDNLAHRGSPSGVIEDVVVDQQRQGQGVGKQMVRFAMERCRDVRCYKLVLSSNIKREAAHRFYEGLGFKRHGFSYWVEIGGGSEEGT